MAVRKIVHGSVKKPIEEVKEVINFMKETNNTMHLTKDLDFLQSIK